MVRFVFRPYTQVRRTICTSVALRASIRVSPDSPFSGIVHHLSGPSKCAHTQTSPKCQLAAGARIPASNIRYAVRFRSCTLAHALDSLVRVSRRVRLNCLVEHKRFAKSKQEDGSGYNPSASPHHISQQNAKPNQAARGTDGSIPDRDCNPQSYHKERFNLLPFQQLHALLTLFPKSFSPFPHGTCSLLVSST